MTIDREAIQAAIRDGRFLVKIGRNFFAAVEPMTFEFGDGTWIIKVRAGPHRARGIITNIDENADGREFYILQ